MTKHVFSDNPNITSIEVSTQKYPIRTQRPKGTPDPNQQERSVVTIECADANAKAILQEAIDRRIQHAEGENSFISDAYTIRYPEEKLPIPQLLGLMTDPEIARKAPMFISEAAQKIPIPLISHEEMLVAARSLGINPESLRAPGDDKDRVR